MNMQKNNNGNADETRSEILQESAQIWSEYIDQLDWGPGQRDESGYTAFLRAGSLKVDSDFALQEVATRISGNNGNFNTTKLQNQIRRAYEHVGNSLNGVRQLFQLPKAVFSIDKLKTLAEAAPMVDEAWLAEKSPVHPDGVKSAEFLNALYENGEKVVVFTDYQSQGQVVFEAGCENKCDLPTHGPEGVWFLANPVDGYFYQNPRQENKLSRRSEESVTSWRYLVLETDTAPSDEWIRALVQLPLKIAAIYTSGGKSVHALVRVDARDKYEWDQIRNRMRPILVTLGADQNAMTAVRLTRLPSTLRGERSQKLLFLNPNPTDIPIVNL
jgi:hypothetical protein